MSLDTTKSRINILFLGDTAGSEDFFLWICTVDIAHRRYKLRRDVEQTSLSVNDDTRTKLLPIILGMED